MFVNTAGSTKAMLTSAFLLPWICHAPAPAAVGSTVVASPFGTLPKLRLLKVVTVRPWPMTFASTPTAPPTPCDTPGRGRSDPSSIRPAYRSRHITGREPRPNPAPVGSAAPAPEPDPHVRWTGRSAAGSGRERVRRSGAPSAAP